MRYVQDITQVLNKKNQLIQRVDLHPFENLENIIINIKFIIIKMRISAEAYTFKSMTNIKMKL